jgi:putative hydrolase of the HAD superfamily
VTVGARAVLLDALGTLLALAPPWPALRRELGERHGIEVSELEARTAMRAEMEYYRAHNHLAADRESLRALRLRCAEVLREALPPDEHEVPLPELVETMLGALRFEPYPDVVPALEGLRDSGKRLAVVSNWDVSLHDVLAETRLTRYFDHVLTSAEVGSAKPAGEIFRRALALTGVGPHAALHVGDSVEDDVVGAHAVGIEPILVARAHPGAGVPVAPAPADPMIRGVRVISSLRELVDRET